MTSHNNFAEAQRRIAERRQAREIAAAAGPVPRQAHDESRLPYPLNRAWDSMTGRDSARPAFRVGQVDAELLDEELVHLLKAQVGEALKYFAGGHLKDDWSDEILLALRAVLFKLTIWDHDASYGAALQNLRYTDARSGGPVLVPPSKWQKSAYGLVTVTGKYAWAKWENWLVDQDDGYNEPTPAVKRLSRLTSRLSTAHSIAALVSFLAFLRHGRYRTLLDRFLRIRLAPPTSQVSREVSFEYQNRQLVWHAFTEFLLFVLPLIGINRWRRWLSRAWRRTKDLVRSEGDNDDKSKGEYGFLPERTCAICYQDQNTATTTETEVMAAAASGGVIGSAQTDITNPYETVPCGCIYCFVCIATRLEREEGESWTCLRCGGLVKECKPWNGDVLQPLKSVGGKSVAFSEDVTGVEFVDEPEEAESSGAQEAPVSTEKAVSSTSSSASSMDSDEGYEEARDMMDELDDE